MWHSLAAFILKQRFSLLALLLAITVYMGFEASKVTLSYDFTSAIPTNNPKYQEYKNFLNKFGEDGNVMVVGVQTDSFFNPSFFRSYNTLVRSLEKSDAVENVFSVPSAINLYKDTISNTLQSLRLVSSDSVEDVASVEATFLNLPFYKGFLYNPTTHTYLMALTLNKERINSKERSAIVAGITQQVDAFSAQHHIAVHYSGLPYIRTITADRVQDEMRLFLILSLVLTATILIVFFRSFVAVAISMLVVGIGVIWSVGTIHLCGYHISILTALIPPLIVVIGIPNCVYFLNKYHTSFQTTGNKNQSLLQMVDKMGIVTLFTNLTAAIGFGVFFFTKSAILKEFGLVAGLNILAIFFISLIIIPVLLSFVAPPNPKHTNYLESPRMQKMLDILTVWVFHHRKMIYVITTALCLVAVAGIVQLKNVGYIVDDLPKNDPLYLDLKFFESNFKGVMPLEIVVDTKRKNGALSLDMMQKMDELVTELQLMPEIGHALCITEGIKFAKQAYYGGDSSNYAVPSMFDAAFLQPYLKTKNTDTVKNAKASIFQKLVQSFVDSNKQQTRISISMADVGSARLPILLDSIKPITYAIFDSTKYQLTFTGTSVVFLEGTTFIINSLRDSLILSFIMIFACMIMLFRSWRILLISVTVNIVPLLITAGIMGWLGIAIKPSTVLVFSVALGITIDVTIRFLVNFKQELATHDEDIAMTVRRTIQDTGLSIIYTSLILIVGFGVFALSHFQGTQSLGYLTSLTLFLAMITNLTLQPAMLLWMEKVLKKKQAKKDFVSTGLHE